MQREHGERDWWTNKNNVWPRSLMALVRSANDRVGASRPRVSRPRNPAMKVLSLPLDWWPARVLASTVEFRCWKVGENLRIHPPYHSSRWMESHRLDSRRKFLTIVRNDDLSIHTLYDPNFTNPEIELSHGIGLNRAIVERERWTTSKGRLCKNSWQYRREGVIRFWYKSYILNRSRWKWTGR